MKTIKQETSKMDEKLETLEINSVEIEQIKNKLEEQTNLAEERLNQMKYLLADFDNYRKKFEKEKENIIKLANENLIKELIIILDDLDSSMKLIKGKTREGLMMIRVKLFSILSRHGLKEINNIDKFNPLFHEVISKEFSEREEGEIIEEIQKGYELNTKVIRPSKVKVAIKEVKNG